MLDITHRHPAGIKAHDHLIEPAQAPGTFRDQGRGERAVPIPRDRQFNVPDSGPDGFGEGTIA